MNLNLRQSEKLPLGTLSSDQVLELEKERLKVEKARIELATEKAKRKFSGDDKKERDIWFTLFTCLAFVLSILIVVGLGGRTVQMYIACKGGYELIGDKLLKGKDASDWLAAQKEIDMGTNRFISVNGVTILDPNERTSATKNTHEMWEDFRQTLKVTQEKSNESKNKSP